MTLTFLLRCLKRGKGKAGFNGTDGTYGTYGTYTTVYPVHPVYPCLNFSPIRVYLCSSVVAFRIYLSFSATSASCSIMGRLLGHLGSHLPHLVQDSARFSISLPAYVAFAQS